MKEIKVKDLIEELKKHDLEATVKVRVDYSEGNLYEVYESEGKVNLVG